MCSTANCSRMAASALLCLCSSFLARALSRENELPSQETVEILEWVALLWILALAKARSAVPISAAISAKRATQARAKINATLEGARQKGSWLRRLLVTAPCGDGPRLLLAICPSASTL